MSKIITVALISEDYLPEQKWQFFCNHPATIDFVIEGSWEELGSFGFAYIITAGAVAPGLSCNLPLCQRVLLFLNIAFN